MEVFVCRKLEEDGFKEEYFGAVKSLCSWKSKDRLAVRIIDYDGNDLILFDVIKYEVF